MLKNGNISGFANICFRYAVLHSTRMYHDALVASLYVRFSWALINRSYVHVAHSCCFKVAQNSAFNVTRDADPIKFVYFSGGIGGAYLITSCLFCCLFPYSWNSTDTNVLIKCAPQQ